jgi:hypothetical protein
MKSLYTSKILDINTAQGLQYKVFIDIMFYTCRRCRENPVYFDIIKQLITTYEVNTMIWGHLDLSLSVTWPDLGRWPWSGQVTLSVKSQGPHILVLSSYGVINCIICTIHTRLDTCLMYISRFSLRDKVTLRLFKLHFLWSGCGRVV